MQNSEKCYIIIGAKGFIGAAVSGFLKKIGYQVFDVLRGEISGQQSDFAFLGNLNDYNGKQLVVIDFAYTSVPNSSFKDPIKDYSENLYNVIRHIEFVRQLPNAVYVYISSGGTVYGNACDHQPVLEDHANVPLSPYGITKLACERYVLMYKEVYNLNVRIVRPSNIYGPGQKPFRGQGLIATAIAKILQQEPIQVFGDGMQVRDYLYIDDFCRVISDIVDYGENGFIYNTGSGTGHTIIDILQHIGSILNEPLEIEYLPFRPFDVRYNVLNSQKVHQLNNWMPNTTLQKGLLQTVEWIKATGLVEA